MKEQAGFVNVLRFPLFNSGELEGLLKSGRRLEADRLGSFDLHRLASLWVTTHTGGTLLHFESSESDDLDFLIFLNASCNGAEHC